MFACLVHIFQNYLEIQGYLAKYHINTCFNLIEEYLGAYSPWGYKELDMTERQDTAQHRIYVDLGLFYSINFKNIAFHLWI